MTTATGRKKHMARPRSISINEDLEKKVKAIAKREHRSFSSMVQIFLHEGVTTYGR